MNKWLDIFQTVLKGATIVAKNSPVGAVLTVVSGIVEAAEVGIKNDDVKGTLQAMAESKWNGLNHEKLERINQIIDEPVE